MKRFLLLCCACLGLSAARAQHTDQLTATLQSDGQSTVYYGRDALKSAVAAAPQDGGVITLSSGSFNNPGFITKSLRIYGAGFELDTVARIEPTKWIGELNIGKDAEGRPPHNLYVEGCQIVSHVTTPDVELRGLRLVKCSFANFHQYAPLTDAIIRQSLFGIYRGGGKSSATCSSRTPF